MLDFFYIRDTVIPNGRLKEFKYLIKHNEDIFVKHIDALMGTAVYHNQLPMIALLNILVREVVGDGHVFNICKDDVNREIYHAGCRNESSKRKDCYISFMTYEQYARTYGVRTCTI
jgi:hypothetical protein